jgi:hypothetical protein
MGALSEMACEKRGEYRVQKMFWSCPREFYHMSLYPNYTLPRPQADRAGNGRRPH